MQGLAGLALLALLAGSTPDGAPKVDSVAARRQADLCTSLTKEPAVAACRGALELGLTPARRAIVYSVLALHLASLQRWPEVVAAYRELVRLRPDDAEAQWRLGDALLFGLGQIDEATAAYRAALRLDPQLAPAHGSLATALSMRGDFAESVAEFEEALRLEPRFFEDRPAARRTYEQALKGRHWP